MTGQLVENASDNLVFRGIDGNEAEEFVNLILARARAAGRLRESDWIADQARACFVEDALWWSEMLTENTKSDWVLLEQAIVTQWPQPNRNVKDRE